MQNYKSTFGAYDLCHPSRHTDRQLLSSYAISSASSPKRLKVIT